MILLSYYIRSSHKTRIIAGPVFGGQINNNKGPEYVPIYGLVRVKSAERKRERDSIDFINDNDSHFRSWIQSWYETEEIMKFSEYIPIPRKRLADFLNKETLYLTCQEIMNKNGFYRLIDHLQQTIKR